MPDRRLIGDERALLHSLLILRCSVNVDNIKYIFCLFRNLLTSLSYELPRLARYQPREFLSARANCGQWIFLAVKFAIVNKRLKQRAERAF